MLVTYSIIVTGKVQGVFYRQSTKEKADALGVKGNVSNLDDGSVQIIATGSATQLQQLIEWCTKGPARAKVEEVTTSLLPLLQFDRFTILR